MDGASAGDGTFITLYPAKLGCRANRRGDTDPQKLLPLFPLYAAGTLVGTLFGATLGIRYLPTFWILVVLGVVLMMSGLWLLWA